MAGELKKTDLLNTSLEMGLSRTVIYLEISELLLRNLGLRQRSSHSSPASSSLSQHSWTPRDGRTTARRSHLNLSGKLQTEVPAPVCRCMPNTADLVEGAQPEIRRRRTYGPLIKVKTGLKVLLSLNQYTTVSGRHSLRKCFRTIFSRSCHFRYHQPYC